jgi:hypothetical protein
MHWRDALRFPLADEHWFRKILFPALLLFVPVIGWLILAGWGLEISRRVIRADPEALPPLRFRQNLRDGAGVWCIGLAGSLPVLFWLAIGSILSAVIFPGVIESNRAWFDAFWWGVESIAPALLLAGGMFSAAAAGRFAATGIFRTAFELPGISRMIRRAPGEFALAAAGIIPLAVFSALGTLICGVGALFTAAYAAAVGFHLAGRAYRTASVRLREEAETTPDKSRS